MPPSFPEKLLTAGLIAILAWLGIRYLLPVALPFLLGLLLALASEPAVTFGARRLGLPRTVATGAGVSLTLLLTALLLASLGALLARGLGRLAAGLPDLEAEALALQDTMLSLAEGMPEPVRPVAQRAALELMDSAAQLPSQLTGKLPSLVTGFVGAVGSSALGVGAFLLSGFLISARLPALRRTVADRLPPKYHSVYLPALRKFRSGLWGWVKAQGKLALVTYVIVTLGFIALAVPYGPLWAAVVALVDAVPILGTGLILVPWAAVSFVKGKLLRGVILLCTYAAAMITRAALEPRLVGRQLGLDPLSTLVALYAGFRLWGFAGMVLTPILACAAKSLIKPSR